MGSPEEVASAQPARISFTLRGLTPQVPVLPGALGSESAGGGRILIRTLDLQQTLTGLLTWAADQHVTLADLEARQGSLEEAFLAVAQSTGPLPVTEEQR